MMNGPNVPTVEEQHGGAAKSKPSSDIDMVAQCRNHGVALAEREKEAKRLADILNVRGMANQIAVHGMTVPAMMIERFVVAYLPLSFSIGL